MKYKLMNEPNRKYSALEQILVNRGVKYEDINHYLNTTDEDINDCKLLGEDKMREAAKILIESIEHGPVFVTVD